MTTTEPTKNTFEKFREDWMLAVLADTTLTAGQKLVLVRLVMHRNRKTGTAWPAASSLAADCAVSLSVARKALRIAEQRGYLVTVRAGHGGQPGSENRTSERGFSVPEAQDPAPNDSNRVPTDTPTVSLRTPNGVPTGYLTTEGTTDYEPLNSTSPTGRGSQFPTGEIEHPTPVGWDQGRADILSIEKRCRAYMEKITGTPPTDDEFTDMLTEMEEWNGDGVRPNWPAAFRGFVRDFYATHNSSTPPNRSQGTTPAAPSSPAPVIDAEIVEDPTDEENTMHGIDPLPADELSNPGPSNIIKPLNGMTMKDLCGSEYGPGRWRIALSAMSNAHVSDEEIMRAVGDGRAEEFPDPDEFAAAVIAHHQTTTADCPF